MRAIYVETYGCQMNLADTELLLGHLGRHGYRRTADPAEADVILLNTCAIREHAEARVLGRLRDLGRHKARRPEVRIGLAGCLAQHLRDRLLDGLPFLDFVVGPDGYRRLPELLAAAGDEPLVDVRLDRDETYADIVPERERGVRAWVTIMRGCNRFCTFCVVPFVRGRERSLPAPVVLGEVRRLVAEGYREVVYLGQTVNAYRHDGVDFAELLRRTDAVPGLRRLRFTSPHPADMTPAVIAAMAEASTVCPQVHLPVQSGSDAVLARMDRGYTRAEFLALVDRLRAAIPGIALTTDIIVGFPGETEADFAATVGLMEAVRFDSAFMFRYSARPGTRAFRWGDTVPEAEKARRLEAVIALQESHSAAINRRAVGTTVSVLVDGPARRPEGWLAGKTPQFKTCVFPAPPGVGPGDLVDVLVTSSTAHTLVGAVAGAAAGARPDAGGPPAPAA